MQYGTYKTKANYWWRNSMLIYEYLLISKVDINYSKIDTNKLIEIDKANSQIITDGKIRVSSVKNL